MPSIGKYTGPESIEEKLFLVPRETTETINILIGNQFFSVH